MRKPIGDFYKQSQRELLIHLRQPRLLLNALLFFMMMAVFFPLSVPQNSALLRQVAPGFIWMAALLSMLFASERLFQQDYEDGVIEQWLVSGQSLMIMITAKMAIHWLLILIPLLIFSPLLALLFGFSWQEMGILQLSLLAGTPAIFSLCALAAAFSTGMQQKGIFMALILLPLTVPVLILGSGTMVTAMGEMEVTGHLAILLAFSMLAVSFLPFAIAAIIRINLAD